MLEGLKDHNVTDVHRIKIRKDDEEIPTKHIVLTIAFSQLPETIEVGYLKINIRPYIPNPRRCFKFQRFGHGSSVSRGRQTCAKCSSNGHESVDCKAAPLCANGEGDHPVYSRSYQTQKREKKIATKAKENITYQETRKRLPRAFQFTAKTNFADVVYKDDAPHQALATAQAKHEAGPPSPRRRSEECPTSSEKGPASLQGFPQSGEACKSYNRGLTADVQSL
ncbi:uncharacterized protein LOC144097742 [Amblyomma americanum]